MEKDSHLIEAVRKLTKPGAKFKQAVAKTKIQPKDDDVVLIDECDDVYFSNPKWFVDTFSTTTVIGFTASVPTQSEKIESILLEQFFRSQIFESKLMLRSRENEP